MIKSTSIRFVFVLFLLAFSCEKIPIVEASGQISDRSWTEAQEQLDEYGLHSEQTFRPNSMSEETYQGAIKAVKKAYQLTDLSFTPLQPIEFNRGTYQANKTYKGMIYSSVKEIGTYVGSNVSIHTFMTAVHNPKSRIYTDRIDESPYNGTNCRAYYGTVCSALVSYALGLVPIHSSYDFVDSEEMEELDYSKIDGFHIADVLWKSGHVAMITNVVRDQNESIVSIEISEAIQSGCRRFTVSRSSFLKSVASSYRKALRYNSLETNLSYSPAPEYVTVFDEISVPFVYNDDICADKGDKSCYFVGENVVLNLMSSGGTVEIYKNGDFLFAVDAESEDIRLIDLDYGFYQARVFKNDVYSGFTNWIMVDKSIVPSVSEMKIYFNSENATPLTISFCNQSGGRSYSLSNIICRRFTEDEITTGCIELSQDKMKADRPYFVITFATEYGNITTTPIKWE